MNEREAIVAYMREHVMALLRHIGGGDVEVASAEGALSEIVTVTTLADRIEAGDHLKGKSDGNPSD